MAQTAKKKIKTGVPNKHLHARITFLQGAATYLTLQASKNEPKRQKSEKSTAEGNAAVPKQPTGKSEPEAGAARKKHDSDTAIFDQHDSGGLPLLLSNHLMQVARKSQIRLQPSVKHQICKRCYSVLSEGTTSRKYVENLSKGGEKPQADVLVVECGICGAMKRWPVGATRQMRKGKWSKVQPDAVKGDAIVKEYDPIDVDQEVEKT